MLQNFLIGFKTHFIDKSTLLSSQQISGSSNFEIFHRNLNSRSNRRKLFYGFNSFLGITTHRAVGRCDEITEGFFITSTHTTPHLVKITQSKILSVMDKHRIGIGNIQSVFDNSGSNKNIKLPIHKPKKRLLQFFSVHLTVAYSNPSIGNEALDHSSDFLDVFHSVVNKKHLPPPL